MHRVAAQSIHPATIDPANPSFGVYVHWPFCAQKCPYCDFNSHVRPVLSGGRGGIDETRFLAAFERELTHTAQLTGPRTVGSIFFGGGTPSLMSAATVAAIIDRISGLWTVDPGAEITLEANPSSVEVDRFRGYRAAGVNRVSLGVQSLRDEQLKRLGRLHSVAEAKKALDIARARFERFTFDLIYARPGQTPAEWAAELAEALAMAGDHLSLYQLTIEPETPFAALHAAGKLVIPDADAALVLYDLTQEMTTAAGLPAYEISNHARPGQGSRHNLLYWRYGEYAGVGPGAHGRLVIDGRRHATVTEKNPERWSSLVEAEGYGFTEVTPLDRHEQADEMLLMGLRLVEGLDLDRLATVGGVRPSEATIDTLVALGMIERLGLRTTSSPVAGIEFGGESDEIPSCLPPGAGRSAEWAEVPRSPAGSNAARLAAAPAIRATGGGRFVLNEIVRQLSASFEPAD
ncbi:MAG: coproporphyrinogen III oxidase [Hyphomicrobium sp.]|nr:MAG: coproporphyrinogen III oxidase [Hyphomicrobium sp.]